MMPHQIYWDTSVWSSILRRFVLSLSQMTTVQFMTNDRTNYLECENNFGRWKKRILHFWIIIKKIINLRLIFGVVLQFAIKKTRQKLSKTFTSGVYFHFWYRDVRFVWALLKCKSVMFTNNISKIGVIKFKFP